MVNSGLYDSAGSEADSVKGDFTQLEDSVTQTAASPRHIVGACANEDNFTATTAEMVSKEEEGLQESATERDNGLNETLTSLLQLDLVKKTSPEPEPKASLQCSVPLYKVKDVLGENLVSNFILENLLKKSETPKMDESKVPKRLLCLFCDRTFTSLNLKQKHVDRCHSAGQNRRSSSRTPGHCQSATACCFCSKLNHTEHSLKQLLEHLVNEHSNRYFGCLTCQERFSSVKALRDHNKVVHNIEEPKEKKEDLESLESTEVEPKEEKVEEAGDSSPEVMPKTTRRRNTTKSPKLDPEPPEEPLVDFEDTIQTNVISSVETTHESDSDEPLKRSVPIRNRSVKKLSVKSTKNGVRNNLRTTRAAVKQMNNRITNTKRNKTKKLVKKDTEITKPVPKAKVRNSSSVFSLVNLFTYKYEKIYDHSSDSIKDANSGKFDAVFDKDFYVRTVSNIQENLLFHLDGKLNRNVQSENRISNFEHSIDSESKLKGKSDNFGCDLSLNAVTPVATLLASSQYGEDFDAQIEYAAKATQKKAKKDKAVKYKFTNRKYNSLYRDKGDHTDLTCLDMWTQLKIKEKQHFLHSDCENFSSRQNKDQVDELNSILDKRGPFEDLRLEAKAAVDENKSRKNSEDKSSSKEAQKDVVNLLDDLLDNVFDKIEEKELEAQENKQGELEIGASANLDLTEYLNLQKSPNKNEIILDKTDKITMICVSEDPKAKNVELSGEWARSRMYICATCALKLPNLKSLEEHKNNFHPHIWCQHYEFVGKQSEYYRHLGIPGLGKVGVVEMTPMTKLWQRSDARLCSKCAKQCHNLGELHRHMLECGGDWTWMLARKKCKYRPYGARTRRRRQRGYKRSCNPDVQRTPREPKIKSVQVGPRVKPSDAETIERMLANLPAKRIRKVISMRDGIQGPRKPYMKTKSAIHNDSKKISQRIKNRISQATNQALQRKMSVRTLRNRNTLNKTVEETENEVKPVENKKKIAKKSINRVLGSKILDSNSTLVSRRHLVKSVIQNNMRRTRLRSKMNSESLDASKETEVSKKTEVIVEENTKKSSEDTVVPENKAKKSTGKRILSLLRTKSMKKLKAKTKPDEKTLEEPPKEEKIVDKAEETAKNNKRLVKNKVIKPKLTIKPSSENTDTATAIIDAVASNSLDDLDSIPLSQIIRKKTSKLVRNVKSFKRSPKKNLVNNKIHNKLTEKSVTSKLMRTLSIRSSKRKKKIISNSVKIEQTKEDSDVDICNSTDPDIKENKEEEKKEVKGIKERVFPKDNSVDKIIESVIRKNTDDLESMPKLEKFEPLPENLPSVESIPILSPVYTEPTPKPDPNPNTAKKLEFNETKPDSHSSTTTLEDIQSSNEQVNVNYDPKQAENKGNESVKSCSTFNKLKNKFKVKGKGLNDCIAMLKCKLEKKTEPTLGLDKSNLFILNACENRGPVVVESDKLVEKNQEALQKNEENEVKIDESKKDEVIDRPEEKIEEKVSKVELKICRIEEKMDKPDEKTSEIEKKPSKNDEKVSEMEEKIDEPVKTSDLKEKERVDIKKLTVLEIPTFTKSLVPTPEPEIFIEEDQDQQINTTEDVPPIVDSIPAEIQLHTQISNVLDVAMKNCLLECVKSKCEELKNGNNVPEKSPKPIRKIGSIRKRKKVTQTKEIIVVELPKSLNDAFISNDETIKVSTEVSDDDDVPLISLIKPSIKIKTPKKERKVKPKISFTPVILNQQQEPEINVKDGTELENSVNNKIKSIQAVSTEETKPNSVQIENEDNIKINQSNVENKTIENLKLEPVVILPQISSEIKEPNLPLQVVNVEEETDVCLNKTLNEENIDPIFSPKINLTFPVTENIEIETHLDSGKENSVDKSNEKIKKHKKGKIVKKGKERKRRSKSQINNETDIENKTEELVSEINKSETITSENGVLETEKPEDVKLNTVVSEIIDSNNVILENLNTLPCKNFSTENLPTEKVNFSDISIEIDSNNTELQPEVPKDVVICVKEPTLSEILINETIEEVVNGISRSQSKQNQDFEVLNSDESLDDEPTIAELIAMAKLTAKTEKKRRSRSKVNQENNLEIKIDEISEKSNNEIVTEVIESDLTVKKSKRGRAKVKLNQESEVEVPKNETDHVSEVINTVVEEAKKHTPRRGHPKINQDLIEETKLSENVDQDANKSDLVTHILESELKTNDIEENNLPENEQETKLEDPKVDKLIINIKDMNEPELNKSETTVDEIESEKKVFEKKRRSRSKVNQESVIEPPKIVKLILKVDELNKKLNKSEIELNDRDIVAKKGIEKKRRKSKINHELEAGIPNEVPSNVENSIETISDKSEPVVSETNTPIKVIKRRSRSKINYAEILNDESMSNEASLVSEKDTIEELETEIKYSETDIVIKRGSRSKINKEQDLEEPKLSELIVNDIYSQELHVDISEISNSGITPKKEVKKRRGKSKTNQEISTDEPKIEKLVINIDDLNNLELKTSVDVSESVESEIIAKKSVVKKRRSKSKVNQEIESELSKTDDLEVDSSNVVSENGLIVENNIENHLPNQMDLISMANVNELPKINRLYDEEPLFNMSDKLESIENPVESEISPKKGRKRRSRSKISQELQLTEAKFNDLCNQDPSMDNQEIIDIEPIVKKIKERKMRSKSSQKEPETEIYNQETNKYEIMPEIIPESIIKKGKFVLNHTNIHINTKIDLDVPIIDELDDIEELNRLVIVLPENEFEPIVNGNTDLEEPKTNEIDLLPEINEGVTNDLTVKYGVMENTETENKNERKRRTKSVVKSYLEEDNNTSDENEIIENGIEDSIEPIKRVKERKRRSKSQVTIETNIAEPIPVTKPESGVCDLKLRITKEKNGHMISQINQEIPKVIRQDFVIPDKTDIEPIKKTRGRKKRSKSQINQSDSDLSKNDDTFDQESSNSEVTDNTDSETVKKGRKRRSKSQTNPNKLTTDDISSFESGKNEIIGSEIELVGKQGRKRGPKPKNKQVSENTIDDLEVNNMEIVQEILNPDGTKERERKKQIKPLLQPEVVLNKLEIKLDDIASQLLMNLSSKSELNGLLETNIDELNTSDITVSEQLKTVCNPDVILEDILKENTNIESIYNKGRKQITNVEVNQVSETNLGDVLVPEPNSSELKPTENIEPVELITKKGRKHQKKPVNLNSEPIIDDLDLNNSTIMPENIETESLVIKGRKRQSKLASLADLSDLEIDNLEIEPSEHTETGSIVKTGRKKQTKIANQDLETNVDEMNGLEVQNSEIKDLECTEIDLVVKKGRKRQPKSLVNHVLETNINDINGLELPNTEINDLEQTNTDLIVKRGRKRQPKSLNQDLETDIYDFNDLDLQNPEIEQENELVKKGRKRKTKSMENHETNIDDFNELELNEINDSENIDYDLVVKKGGKLQTKPQILETNIDECHIEVNTLDIAEKSDLKLIIKTGKGRKRKPKVDSEELDLEIQGLNQSEILIPENNSNELNLGTYTESTILEHKPIENLIAESFADIPKTPTINMVSDDSEDELPLSFLAKNLTQNDDDVLNDISENLETPSILANNDLAIEDESVLPLDPNIDLTDLLEDKNVDDLDKIDDESILDISFDIVSNNTDKSINTTDELIPDNLELENELNLENITSKKILPKLKLNLNNTESLVENLDSSDLASDFITTPDLNNKSLVIKIQKNFNCKLKKAKKTRKRVIIKPVTKRKVEEESMNIICEICNKTFRRTENLMKHKRTLTHISKLSEIEAKENEARQTKISEDEKKEGSESKEESNLEIDENDDEDLEELEKELEKELKESNRKDQEIVEIEDEDEEELVIEVEPEVKIDQILKSKVKEDPIETIDLIEDISTDVEKSSEPFPVVINNKNSNLKLVDIINDVLDKPVNDLNMAESVLLSKNITNSIQSHDEPKRYKSLGERKSFDSDNYVIPQKSEEVVENNTAIQSNNQMLSKQLTLLENIIEKSSPELTYSIDDSISYSSNQFDETIAVRNITEKDLFRSTEYPIKFNEPQIKFSHNTDIISSFIKPDGHFTHFKNNSQSFAKPVNNFDESSQQQYQENEKNFKENSSTRKILNRDEELFLECCSLLKSGSEISSVSKKSTKQIPLHNFSNDGAWIDQKQGNNFIQRDSYSWLAQGSRGETPIGEPFVNNDWSNSNSAVSSEWLAQKAASPDQPVENNTLSKKTNNTNYSNIQFEDISVDSSLTRNTEASSAEKSKENNIPLDFHNVKFSKTNLEFKEAVESENVDEKSSDGLNIDPDVVSKDETNDETSAVDEEEGEKEEKAEENHTEVDEDLKRHVVSAFGGLMAKALKCRLKAVVRRSNKAKEKRTFVSTLQSVITDYTVPVKKSKLNVQELASENSIPNDCPKKIVTKGAMKVFEGLKVSIPTQDLNLQEVLKGKSVEKEKATEVEENEVQNSRKKTNKKRNVFKNFGNKLGLKETKKKNSKKHKDQVEDDKKSHDVYDFEESEDNTSIFNSKSLTVFRNIRTTTSEPTEVEKLVSVNNLPEPLSDGEDKLIIDSESETDRYYDSVSFEENSISSESVLEPLDPKLKGSPDKNKKDEKKKCMIMGRIFKNASKPKLEDKIPEIRDISSEENSKLVETYLESYSSIDNIESTVDSNTITIANNLTIINSANKMSKHEMDFLFDKLLQDNKNSPKPTREEPAPVEVKTTVDEPRQVPAIEVKSKEEVKEKPKIVKAKKRKSHHSEDSASTDEFTLSGKTKTSKKHKKHPRKNNSKKKNGGINLEQEMKECIGVAGRKSQRKCTSGKQNVLVEFWSSDESEVDFTELFEATIEPEVVSEGKIEETSVPTEAQVDELPINNIEEPVSEPVKPVEEVKTMPEKIVSLEEINDLYEFEPELEDLGESIPLLKKDASQDEKHRVEKHKKSMKIKNDTKRHSKSKEEGEFDGRKAKRKGEHKKKRSSHSESSNTDSLATSRRKRNAVETLYYWSSTSDDEFQDLIEVKPVREDTEDDRPMQHGWIVGDSPKKLVTMLAQAKGKKIDCESVKEQKKNRTTL